MNKKLSGYALKRLILGIVTLLVIVTITFWLMRIVPGGPWNKEKTLPEAVQRELNHKFGLDQPLFVQYLIYIKNAFTFNFGPSFKYQGRQVTEIIGDGLRISLPIGACAALLALVLGVVFGTVAATHQNKWFDRVIMVLTTGFVAIPSFVIAMVLLFVFAVVLQWVPTSPASQNDITAYILPVIAEALYPTAYITRLMRSSTLDALGQDYMRTARSKGLSESKILVKHGVRNSVTPVITYFGPMFASIITGSFVVEKVFQIPGIGPEFINSITARDYPLIMGTTCVLAFFLIVFSLLSDLLYMVVNPRVDFD